MRHSFGPYILDENARELSLQGRPVSVQPLVFDLLVHLVRNAGRVVPKDELMDAIWPDVIVTEASLQRLVSLARRALDPGGLGTAIRSFVRHGYRFSVDQPVLWSPGSPPMSAAPTGRRRSIASGAATGRPRARHSRRLDAAVTLAADDIDAWALAVECRGRLAEAIPLLIRAIAAHLARRTAASRRPRRGDACQAGAGAQRAVGRRGLDGPGRGTDGGRRGCADRAPISSG